MNIIPCTQKVTARYETDAGFKNLAVVAWTNDSKPIGLVATEQQWRLISVLEALDYDHTLIKFVGYVVL